MREEELRAPLEAYLAPRGFRLRFDPDGSGYFDAVALRGEEVGLVELKVADWRRVFEQALVRRGWGDWVAVLLPRRSLAEKVLGLRAPPAAKAVGVWYLDSGQVRELRQVGPFPAARGEEAFGPLKRHLVESLAMLESGLLPPGVEWRIVRRPRRRGPRGRPIDPRLWRIEEFASDPDLEAGASRDAGGAESPEDAGSSERAQDAEGTEGPRRAGAPGGSPGSGPGRGTSWS